MNHGNIFNSLVKIPRKERLGQTDFLVLVFRGLSTLISCWWHQFIFPPAVWKLPSPPQSDQGSLLFDLFTKTILSGVRWNLGERLEDRGLRSAAGTGGRDGAGPLGRQETEAGLRAARVARVLPTARTVSAEGGGRQLQGTGVPRYGLRAPVPTRDLKP